MLEIRPVASVQHVAALDLLFRDHAPEERREQADELLADLRAGGVSGEGLLGAHHGGRLVGVVFAQVQPGRTAAVWPPRVADGEPDATADRLLGAATDWLSARQDVCLAQVLMPLGARDDAARLRAHRFVHLADLLYLVSLEIEFPAADPAAKKGPGLFCAKHPAGRSGKINQVPFSLRFEPCANPSDSRLAGIVQASYEGTLDCPLLNEVRQIGDVLEGYRAGGVFHPNLWLIASHAGRDVGCLILSDHPRHGNLELVYMGVLPAWRGRGWGGQLARKAQWIARRLGRPRLVLAVDAANQPAVAAYIAAGFQAWDRRRAMVRLFGPGA